MNSLKKQNKMLFNLAKKTITLWELKNINNIKKSSYDSSRSDNSRVYSDLGYINSSIMSLSEGEVEDTLRRETEKMDHVVSTNTNSNQVNEIIKNELKFDSIDTLAINPVNNTPHIVTIILRCGKKSRKTLNPDLTCLCYSGSTDRMMKRKYINPYQSKLRANKV